MDRWFPISTERLLLREYRPEDETEIHDYACDMEVVRLMPWGPNSLEQTREVLHGWLVKQQEWPRDAVTLAIELASEKRVIGGIELRTRGEERTGDFGYVIHRSYWGKGYASEALQAVAAAAFGKLGLHRLWARCDAENPGSYRVMEKLGMRREGHCLQDRQVRGEWRDSYHYAILQEEWAKR